MRKLTIRTVFQPLFRITEISSTFVPQCIQRAVTEQTVKIIRISAFMAGKIFTLLMAKKRILFVFPIFLLHITSKKEGAMLFRGRRFRSYMRGGNENPKQYRLPFNLYNSHEQAIIP